MNLLRLERVDDAGHWAMKMAYHEKFPELAKSVPGLQWKPRPGVWIGYADAVTLMAAHLEKAGIAKVVGSRPTLREPLSDPGLRFQLPKGCEPLRYYQRSGVRFLMDTAREGALLADGMGTGKTSVALAAIGEGLKLPAVVVCPANVKTSWLAEGKRLGLDVHLLYGMSPPSDAQIEKSDGIVALNYELVDKWLPHLENVGTVIFDEGQMLTNEKSKRSKACAVLAKRAENRIIMTGTPFLNRPMELWNVVNTMSPGRLGKWLPFMKRYAGAFQEEVPVRGGEDDETQKVWNTKGSSHTDELSNRLKHFMLRRTKQDVKLELPSKTRQLLEIDVSKQYRNPDRWWSLKNTNQAQIALGLAAEGKIEAAVELALNAVKNNSSVILFMHRKEVAQILRKRFAKEGIKAFMLTGDETAHRREQNAHEARAQGSAICIATIEAVGTGVNYLTFADIAIFVELHYVPGKMMQAEDRLHRPGQENPVTIYFLIAMGSIDEMIRDAILTKLRAFEDVVGNVGDTIRDDLLGGLSDEDALDQLRRTLMEDEGGLYGVN